MSAFNTSCIHSAFNRNEYLAISLGVKCAWRRHSCVECQSKDGSPSIVSTSENLWLFTRKIYLFTTKRSQSKLSVPLHCQLKKCGRKPCWVFKDTENSSKRRRWFIQNL